MRKACQHSNITGCSAFIDCGSDRASDQSKLWNKNVNATACLDSSSGAFPYGIYVHVVPLTIETRVVKKYVFALFWGFQVCVSFFSFLFLQYQLCTSMKIQISLIINIHIYRGHISSESMRWTNIDLSRLFPLISDTLIWYMSVCVCLSMKLLLSVCKIDICVSGLIPLRLSV